MPRVVLAFWTRLVPLTRCHHSLHLPSRHVLLVVPIVCNCAVMQRSHISVPRQPLPPSMMVRQ
eukprot:4964738-Alexandrium_andersonii.AAC.1